ncbi:MAG: polysaccharide deacetylase family protein [Novosphingobium sp.]|nr:polysaccharide deacetylase family protein [Novosphingobium sp.]
MKRAAVLAFYRLCRALGLFRLARRLTRSHLRILCYHGFVLDDEDRFRESLFVSRDFLERRMRYLADEGFQVLTLDEALVRLREGTLPSDCVTITIDDGFHSVHAVAREVLEGHGFPSTLYLTSYYFEKGTPIFQLAVDYMCWKSKQQTVDLSRLGIPALASECALELTSEKRRWVSETVHAYGTEHLGEEGRVALSRRLAACLDVDYERIAESRILSLITPDELKELEASGMAIELHTHRHRFPNEAEAAASELADNRAAIEPLLGRRMAHFCYPSGKWSPDHQPVLAADGIASATTCESGLAHAGSNLLALPRFLDDNRVSQVEFEAELTGFSELCRKALGRA